MADRPILFSGPMIRALLDGRKTQTRRTFKPKPDWTEGWLPEVRRTEITGPLVWPIGSLNQQCGAPVRAPKIAVGYHLWVKETWKPHSIYADLKPSEIPPSNIFFRADDAYAPSNTNWWPSLFMPRWASRLTLTVTDVRVERLQDISEDDAIAEGVELERYVPVSDSAGLHSCGEAEPTNPVEEYRELWDSINGPGSWEANPWIVAYTFTVERGNIDQIGRSA